MPAYYLEALTVTLGLILLMAEAFVPSKSKAWVGVAAAIGLGAVLALTSIAIGPQDKPGAGWAQWPLWNFYQFDKPAVFYKAFALLTTILVVLMSIDYRKVLARFTDHPGSENGTGEFYALPVFACAGMMWLASAKDLAGSFVALELVTVTFYILVAYMRRNVGSLEAGVKYLILGALSTGFLVYGIAWVYGTTGTMSFDALPSAISNLQSPIPLLFGIGGPRFQGRCGADADVDSRCLSRRANSRHRIPFRGFQSGGLHPDDALPRCLPHAGDEWTAAQPARRPGHRDSAFRQPCRHSTVELQAPARLFIHRPRGFPDLGIGRGSTWL